jgi:hypothetical protein
MCSWRSAVAALLVSAGAATSARAQVVAASDSTAVINGAVVSAANGEVLPRAQITIGGTARGTITDSDGRFTITGLRPGTVSLHTRALGYRMATRAVIVRAGERAEVIITMEPLPQTLNTVQTIGTTDERDRFERGTGSGVLSLGGAMVSKVPSIGEADVLRTVQLLPGVTSRSDFTAGYNVRGGESDQNLVLLDGIPIYNPFHFGGLFGTFLEPTVSEVNLYLGGFSAEYGGRLSSVLDVRSAEEERPGVHGTAGVSLLASSLALSGALPDRGFNWTVAARRTYADMLARAFSDRVLPYHFQDAQAHVTQRLPHDASLSVTAYAGLDDLSGNFAALGDSTSASGGGFGFNWGNQIAGATLTVPLGAPPLDGDEASRPTLVQRVSFSRFATTLDLGDGSLGFANRVSEARIAGSLSATRGRHTPIIGYEGSLHRVSYRITSSEADVLVFDLGQRPTALSLYAEDLWRPSDAFRLRAGLRAERVEGRGWFGISPRFSATYFLSPDMSVSLSGGQFSQWMHGLRNEDIPVRIFDFWVASDRYIDVSSARHAVLGVERWLSRSQMIRVEAFFKKYDRLLEPNAEDDPAIRGDEFIPTSGQSYGFDVLLRQLERGPLSGWIAYSYAVSSRQRGALDYFPAQDRRHNVNAIATYTLGTRNTLSARFGFGTGLPFTDIVGQIVRRSYDPATNTWTVLNAVQRFEAIGGARNTSRYPVFQRLDLMASRRYTKRRTTITPYFQVVNAYNRRNVFIYTFDYTSNPPERQATSQFPFLPSIGVTVEF